MPEQFVSKRQQVARYKKSIATNDFKNAHLDEVGDVIDRKPTMKVAVEDLSQLVLVVEARLEHLEELLGQRG